MLARELEGVYRKGKLNIKSVCMLNGGIFPEVIQPIRLQTLMRGRLGPIIGRLMNRSRFGQSFSSIFGPDSQPSQSELDIFWNLITHNQGRRVMHKIIQYMNDRIKHRERWVGALQKTSVPPRLIIGPEDPISGQKIADCFYELVPNPDVVLLPGIGHYPQVEAPEQVWQAYSEFRGKL
jgi:pimeloyl-ACP methyl ester carboxylesterase